MNVQILGLEEVAKIKCNDKGSFLEASGLGDWVPEALFVQKLNKSMQESNK